MSISFTFGFGYIPGFLPSLLTTTTETSYITVKVYPLFYKKIIVEWGIPSSWGDCSFNVYKGDTEVGPWNKVNITPLTNTNFFEDTTTQDFSKFHRSFYIVEARLPAPDNRYIKSPISTWENKRSNLMEIRAREITRRETILLDKFNGTDTLVFRKKYFGTRCPNCYNPEIEKITKDHCTTCFGTSFIDGYFPGMLTKVCYEISPNNTQLTYLGKLESNQTAAWTISFPEVHTHDLILRVSDSRLFRVESTNPTELQTVHVRQIMQIVELGKHSVEMNLLKNITPERYVLPLLGGTNVNLQTGYLI